MDYDTLRHTVTGSSASDWAMLDRGPLYLDRLTQVSDGNRTWLEADSHHYLAVYKPDVSLRLAWGLELDDRLTFEGWAWPDPSISRFAVDAFWQGSLTARWTLLLVDGARSYLPDPARADDGNGWTADSGEIALAALLQEIVGRPRGQFESYMERAEIVAVP